MLSFRDARPPNFPPDMATLAQQMELSRPVLLSKLIGYLSAPTAVQFKLTGVPEVSGVAASAAWTLNAQGFWNFTGSVNNSNAITQQWAVGMALPVQGQSFWVNAQGQVGPNLPLFSNTASWNYTGFDQRIVDFWPEIFGARSATAAANLQVSINAGDILEAVGISLGVAGVAALVAAVVLIGPDGKGGWQCDPPTVGVTGDAKGIGVEVTMKCQK
jgi:hypothetical protein